MPGPFSSPRPAAAWPGAALRAALAATLLPLAAPVARAEDAAAWRVAFTSERHSDATALAALRGADPFDHLSPRRGSNFAYVDDRLSAGVAAHGWQVDLLVRNHGSLVANRDALDVARQAGGRGADAYDRQWQPHVRLLAFTGAGLAVRHEWTPDAAWRLAAGLQALGLRHWRGRRLDGQVQWLAGPQQYRFDLRSDEQDDRLRFPFQQPFSTSGRAALLDLSLAWASPRAAARLDLWDLGWLHWRGLPRQEASLATDRTTSDATGFVLYGPLVEGRNRQDGVRERLSGSIRLAGEWAPGGPAGDGRATLQARRIDAHGPVLWALGWRSRAGLAAGDAAGSATARADGEPPRWQLQWHLRERRLDLGLAWGACSATVGADRLSARARSQHLALACQASY